MKKKVIMRSLLGAPIGLTLSTIITIVISAIFGNGNFYPVVPELITDCGTELNAMILQTIFSLLYGAAFGGASVIWEQEDWSLLKQTLLHLLICSLFTFPIAYATRWMSHNIKGILLYFGIFFFIYAFIWIPRYLSVRKSILEINAELRNTNEKR